MDKEEKALLKRNTIFFEEAKNKEFYNKPEILSQNKKIFKHIYQMIERGQVKNMMGIEAVFNHCREKLAEDKSAEQIDKYVDEIKNFIS